MTTDKQRKANQRNAQKSTGPRTPEGKANSARNRFTHGFFAASTFAPGEDRDAFIALTRDFMDTFLPANSLEQSLVEQMVHNKWLELRAMRMQGQLLMHNALEKVEFGVPKELGLLIRAHSSALRGYRNAWQDLVKLQKERGEHQNGFDPENDYREVRIQWVEAQPYPENPPQTPKNDPEPEVVPGEAPPKAA